LRNDNAFNTCSLGDTNDSSHIRGVVYLKQSDEWPGAAPMRLAAFTKIVKAGQMPHAYQDHALWCGRVSEVGKNCLAKLDGRNVGTEYSTQYASLAGVSPEPAPRDAKLDCYSGIQCLFRQSDAFYEDAILHTAVSNAFGKFDPRIVATFYLLSFHQAFPHYL
jgi:hypothetical protein